MKKSIISIVALALMCLCFAGTTYAWLVDKTEPIKNTFVAGNINISLSDATTREVKMVPGATIEENAKVTVQGNSEDCWLFIKATKSDNFDTYLSCTMAEGWTLVPDTLDVYYREVALSADAQVFDILNGRVITVKSDLTKTQYNSINSNDYPTLEFTAYAVQKLGFDTVGAAWVEAQTLR